MTKLTTPTHVTYAELQHAYDHFNRRLFGGQLPVCLITLQREKRTCGYFSSQRFANLDGQTTDEIAMNPAYFAVVPILEIMQTLVHEMTHLWQHHFGKPGRGRYHNEEWANKMESIGLMPSSTGQPGGKRTGDHMADYAIKGGLFLSACEKLLTGRFQISWYDRFPAPEHIAHGQGLASMADGLCSPAAAARPVTVSSSLAEMVRGAVTKNSGGLTGALDGIAALATTPQNRSNRIKYSCSCAINVWGKPGLAIICGQCQERFVPV